MSFLVPILFAWLMILTVIQCVLLRKYVVVLRNKSGRQSEDAAYPPVVAILCMLGADPFLRECILRLLDCDYSQLTERIVVDSLEDPAILVVSRILAERNDPRAKLMGLPERRGYCSGKVNGLLVATENLPPDCEIVVWIDTDSLLYRSAIKELAEGLSLSDVGAVSGNRWYSPSDASFPGLASMCWNSIAVSTMNLFGILWGRRHCRARQ